MSKDQKTRMHEFTTQRMEEDFEEVIETYFPRALLPGMGRYMSVSLAAVVGILDFELEKGPISKRKTAYQSALTALKMEEASFDDDELQIREQICEYLNHMNHALYDLVSALWAFRPPQKGK